MAEALIDDPQATNAENALAARILLIVAALLVICAVIVVLFGLPALGILGLVGTAVIWAALLSIMAGN
ncbi:hypothetical protein [Paracoccus xiamenensis]|uniref:hypothetical protein n=1 Tax=Paracoccus xiamenensis TaxID=2714901 RepID=UPI00140934B1|nr:hypothetical protein [Paracoccus xiamenensis]NHF74070.1 hypothetical protein [Paracoccus xiamenensis]